MSSDTSVGIEDVKVKKKGPWHSLTRDTHGEINIFNLVWYL